MRALAPVRHAGVEAPPGKTMGGCPGREPPDRRVRRVTPQDVLASARSVILFDTPTLRDKLTTRGAGRTFLFGLTWNLGAQNPRRRQDPAFEFQQPAPEAGQ
jgi:hypothetical protein